MAAVTQETGPPRSGYTHKTQESGNVAGQVDDPAPQQVACAF